MTARRREPALESCFVRLFGLTDGRSARDTAPSCSIEHDVRPIQNPSPGPVSPPLRHLGGCGGTDLGGGKGGISVNQDWCRLSRLQLRSRCKQLRVERTDSLVSRYGAAVGKLQSRFGVVAHHDPVQIAGIDGGQKRRSQFGGITDLVHDSEDVIGVGRRGREAVSVADRSPDRSTRGMSVGGRAAPNHLGRRG